MFSLSETARQMLLIFGIASSGYLLGRVHIKGISLGTSGIFLTGLLFGHFGAQLPESVQTLGLLLFITSVGLSAGPTFFRQLRTNGAAYCALCLSVAVIGALVCAGIILLGALLLAYGAWLIYPPAGFVVAGVLCLLWSWLVARYLDRTQSSVGGGK